MWPQGSFFWLPFPDTDQHHVHIAANRVNPTTGRTVKLSFEKRKLSQWALENEQKRGCIEVPGRLVRKEWRDEARELFQQRDEARATGDARRAWELTRTLEQHRDRRPAIEPTRGPGGEARSPEERRRWLLHFDQERDERERRGTTAVAKDQRAARVRLSLRIDRDRVRAERRQQRAERRTARVAKRRQQRATAVAAVAAGARRVGAALADGARWTGPVAAAGTRRVGTALADGARWTGPVVAAGTRLVGRALAAGARRTDRAIVAAPSRTVDRILALIPGGDVAEYQDAWDRAYHASSRRPRPSAPTPRLLTPRMSVTTRVSLTLA